MSYVRSVCLPVRVSPVIITTKNRTMVSTWHDEIPKSKIKVKLPLSVSTQASNLVFDAVQYSAVSTRLYRRGGRAVRVAQLAS